MVLVVTIVGKVRRPLTALTVTVVGKFLRPLSVIMATIIGEFLRPRETLTTAVGGIYTAATKGGIAVVSSGTAWSTLTGPTIGANFTIASVGLDELTADALYLSLTTPQGAAATADVFVFGWPLT